jgi:RHS repeat-associated protein
VVSNSGIDGNATNGTTEYFYKDWQTIEEQDGSGNVLRQYVYGRYIDEPLTLDDRSDGQTIADLNDGTGDDRLFYHCNTLYSTFALTDEAGSIVEGYQYDAYGRQTVITNPGSDGNWFTDDDTLEVNGDSAVDNPYMFQGRRFDGETELHYYRNRYYNSRLGRFISRDPMGVWYDVEGYGNGYSAFSLQALDNKDPYGLLCPQCPNIIEDKMEQREQRREDKEYHQKARAAYDAVNDFIDNHEQEICEWLDQQDDCEIGSGECGCCDLPRLGYVVVSWRPWLHYAGFAATTIAGTGTTIINLSVVKEDPTGSVAIILGHEWVHQVCGIASSELFGSSIAFRFQNEFGMDILDEVD